MRSTKMLFSEGKNISGAALGQLLATWAALADAAEDLSEEHGNVGPAQFLVWTLVPSHSNEAPEDMYLRAKLAVCDFRSVAGNLVCPEWQPARSEICISSKHVVVEDILIRLAGVHPNWRPKNFEPLGPAEAALELVKHFTAHSQAAS